MSQLQKLAIQGIRSFGPDESRRIEFHSPLTLILGQNGCGKTTIIESLKFITTGEVPPGCGKGAAFVHDPKIAKESVVRGQIKLRFYNTKRQVVTASRSVEVVQKAKRIEFSSLDSTITVELPDGRKHSVSSKCVDFHSEMINLLGISKPILENVIFCHQEDSNWPLDEGKRVKDKFDSIFNATKYIKCLDSIRKLRRDKKQSINQMQEMLEALKMKKEHVDRLQKDQEEVDREITTVENDKDGLRQESEPIKARLKEILGLESKIQEIQQDIRDKEFRLKSLEDLKAELKSTQRESYDCSDSELTRLIQDFEFEADAKRTELNKLKRNLNDVTREIDSLKDGESKALRLVGQLESLQKTHTENLEKLDKTFADLAAKYEISRYLSQSHFELNDADGLLKELKSYIDKKRKEFTKDKKAFEQKESELLKEIESIKMEEAVYQHDITMLTKQIEDTEKKTKSSVSRMSSLKRELSLLNSSDLRRKLEKINETIQETKEKVDVSELTETIEMSKEQQMEVRNELNVVRKKVARLNQQAEFRSKLDIHVKDKETLEQKNKYLRAKHSEDFRLLFGSNVETNLKSRLDAAISENKNKIKMETTKKSKLEKSKAEVSLKVENERKNIEKRERDIKDFENRIEEVISGTDLESAIKQCKEEMDNLVKSMSEQESAVKVMERFKEKINDGEGCPLCHRDFDSENHKDDLITEIQEKLSRLPHSLVTMKQTLLQKEHLYDQLLRLRPMKGASDEAKSELDSLRSRLRNFQQQRDSLTKDIEENSVVVEKLSSRDDAFNRIQSDVITIDNNTKNIANLAAKISSLQATLGGSTDEFITMEDLMKEQERFEKQLNSLRQEIESAQEKIMKHNGQLQKLETQKLDLSTKLLQVETKELELNKLKQEIDNLHTEKSTLSEKIDNSRMALAPIKYQLTDKVKEKNELSEQKNQALDGQEREIQAVSNDVSEGVQLQQVAQKYIREKRQEKFADAKEELLSIQRSSSKYLEKKKNIEEQIQSTGNQLDKQWEHKKSLECEKKIREKDAEAQKLVKNISSLKVNLSDMDGPSILEQKENLARSQHKILKKQAMLDGRMEELEKKKKDLTSQLNSNDSKNAHKKYLEKLVYMKCADLACQDLNKYYQALDTAVMRFHREKMTTINGIIRELWRTTYRGNDIDYIEIQTDETESQGADKRRTYNYRVVMVKTDVEMDMRGRCSAGQKVLASLIIRMALAETFSSNCGILALDEPTTNLDRENIEALSLALLNIVNKRSAQKNLQLIVITHDDEFLERLTRADFIEYYYKVSRNDRGLSVITRHNAQ